MALNAAKAIAQIATAIRNNPATASAVASAYNTKQSQQFAREQMAFQQASNQQAMAFSAAQAAENRDWQEKMSNTAHQREVKDLIAAGLNPVLSANAGASTPSGNVGSGFSSSGASGSVDTSYVNAIASILQTEMAQQTQLDIAKINQQTQLATAQLGYDASLKTANISAATQTAINNANIRNQEYMAKYYPNTQYGLLSSGLNMLKNGITSGKLSGVMSSVLDAVKQNVNSGAGRRNYSSLYARANDSKYSQK